MQIESLKVFCDLTETESFTKAAQINGVTQSAVSQTIRKLEDELGEALFDRSSREGVLTDAGKVLFEYAEKLESFIHRMNVSRFWVNRMSPSIMLFQAMKKLLPLLYTVQ